MWRRVESKEGIKDGRNQAIKRECKKEGTNEGSTTKMKKKGTRKKVKRE